MDTKEQLLEYKSYLLLAKKLSLNSIEAYMRDIGRFVAYLEAKVPLVLIENVDNNILEEYIIFLHGQGVEKSSLARSISGVKSFFTYLYIYDKIDSLPTELIESPKIRRKIPDYLSISEIEKMITEIDVSRYEGHRNRAILELMYSCGLRVSEVVELKLADLFFDDGFIRVIGKGDKQRLVPISLSAIRQINLYMDGCRKGCNVETKYSNHLFLNRRGSRLSRVMIFNIVKGAALAAEVTKHVSPHTLRHTFATHLIKGGADIRMVQQMLGHSSITTTEIYTHLSTSDLHKAIKSHPYQPK